MSKSHLSIDQMFLLWETYRPHTRDTRSRDGETGRPFPDNSRCFIADPSGMSQSAKPSFYGRPRRYGAFGPK